jgi:hypothetical protein
MSKNSFISNLNNKYIGVILVLLALVYPNAVIAIFHSGELLRRTTNWATLFVGTVAFIASLLFTFGVPVVSFNFAYHLGQINKPSPFQLYARRFAHLTFASPPLFTCVGVFLYILGIPNTDWIVWAIAWILVVFVTFINANKNTPQVASSRPQIWRGFRIIHGISALGILLIFLLPHIANHLTAIWSINLHISVMKILRTLYRSNFVEPILIVFFICQIISGVFLWRQRTTYKSDFFGTLQTTSGTYLSVFIVSHMTAVFVLGRIVQNVDTNFYFASGGEAGLLVDPWNVRLIPHYSLGVLMLFAHLACGFRFRLLTQKNRLASVNKIAVSIIMIGAVIAVTIILSMCGMHLASN